MSACIRGAAYAFWHGSDLVATAVEHEQRFITSSVEVSMTTFATPTTTFSSIDTRRARHKHYSWCLAFLMLMLLCAAPPTLGQQITSASTSAAALRAPLPTPLGLSPTDSRWIYRSNPPNDVALVFIHGLAGDPVKT